MSQKARCLVAQTDNVIDFYKDYYKNEMRVILNPINNELVEYSKSFEASNDNNRCFLFVGRLSREKNVELLIKSFSRAYASLNNYSLRVVGDGPLLGDLKKLAIDLGVGDNVIFEGRLNSFDKIYKKGNIFVLPSFYEGLSNSLIEALYLGLPCIATDCPCGGSSYLINYSSGGVLTRVNNIDDMSSSMIQIVKDATYRDNLSLSAKSIRKIVNFEYVYNSWLELVLDKGKELI